MKKFFPILGIAFIGIAGLCVVQYSQAQSINVNPVKSVPGEPVVAPSEADTNGVAQAYAKQMAEMNVYVVAVEAYAVDNTRLPAHTFDANRMIYGDKIGLDAGSPSGYLPTFARLTGGSSLGPFTLTTPVSYVPSLPGDCFGPTNTPVLYVTKDYANGDQSYLIWTMGPDQDYDLDYKEWMKTFQDFPEYVILAQYDPTNGITSSGDILKNGFANWSELPKRLQ